MSLELRDQSYPLFRIFPAKGGDVEKTTPGRLHNHLSPDEAVAAPRGLVPDQPQEQNVAVDLPEKLPRRVVVGIFGRQPLGVGLDRAPQLPDLIGAQRDEMHQPPSPISRSRFFAISIHHKVSAPSAIDDAK